MTELLQAAAAWPWYVWAAIGALTVMIIALGLVYCCCIRAGQIDDQLGER